MFKYNLGLVILSVMIFGVPSLATAKPDQPQIQHASVTASEFVCSATNLGADTNTVVRISIIDATGTTTIDIEDPVAPGSTLILSEPATRLKFGFGRCTVEWFGKPDDILGSLCGIVRPIDSIVANTCLRTQ
jgi:hypothetical protein